VQKLHHIICLLVLTSFSSISSAALLDFNDENNLGVTLGGNMKWSDIGGGHLYNDISTDNDFIFFLSASTYVNSFQMNALPWQDYTRDNMVIGSIDVSAQNAADETLWSSTVNLTDYTDWSDWLTVSVERANVTQLTFFAPGLVPHSNNFWPSIDNMVINHAAVPVPAAIWLFASGLLGILGLSHKRR
jgi:hypothetical protein